MYREEFSRERAKISECKTEGTLCPCCGRHLVLKMTGAFEVLLCVRCGYCYEYEPRQMMLGEV